MVNTLAQFHLPSQVLAQLPECRIALPATCSTVTIHDDCSGYADRTPALLFSDPHHSPSTALIGKSPPEYHRNFDSLADCHASDFVANPYSGRSVAHGLAPSNAGSRHPQQWQNQYHRWQPRSRLQPDAIEQRITSLGGCVQVLAKELSHCFNQHTNNRGSCWEPRFRSCLLADDSAICAMALSLTQENLSAKSLQTLEDLPLATLPLLRLPSNQVIPADQGPLGTLPTGGDDELINDLQADLNSTDHHAWRSAWNKALAIGRPESLAETLGRLDRARSRSTPQNA